MATGLRRRLGRLRTVVHLRPPASSSSPAATTARPSEAEIGQRRLATFRQILGVMVPGRLLDLGAGHVKFSITAKYLAGR